MPELFQFVLGPLTGLSYLVVLMVRKFGGFGKAIAMWVNFEWTLDFTMLAFPCGVDLLRFQATISAFALLRVVVQLISSWSRLPVR